MKGKRIKVEILIGVALLLIISGALGMTMGPKREADKTLSNRFGDVTWNHELHVRMKEISNCSVCHHAERPGKMNPRPCRDCHKLPDNREALITPELFMPVEKASYEGTNGPPAMTALHGKCLGCHKAMKKGPAVCRDCHAQTFTKPGDSAEWSHMNHSRKRSPDGGGFKENCVSCHHKDPKAETKADYRPCGACHKTAMEQGLDMATKIKDHLNAKHGQCQECHVEFNPEDDNISCAECHKGIRADAKETAPTLELAIHKKCGECHHKDNPDLEETAPKYCSDCHRPDPSWITVSQTRSIFWNHERHGEFGGYSCEKCHHKDHSEGPKLACRSCHGKEFYDNPPLEDALKKNCLGCHKEKNVGLDSWESATSQKAVPKHFKYKDEKGEFWWDHAFHALDLSFSCRDCHHNIIVDKDGKYATALSVGQDWPEEAKAVQSCGDCHGKDGPTPKSAAWKAKAPKMDNALKKVCLECHQKLGGGPRNWEDFFKTEPLEKR